MDGAAEGSDANEDLLDVGHHSMDVLLRNGPGLQSHGPILDEEFFMNVVGRGIQVYFHKEFENFLGQFPFPSNGMESQKPNKKKKGTMSRLGSLG